MAQDRAPSQPAALQLLPVACAGAGAGAGAGGQWMLTGDLYLQDHPGELAELSSTIARHHANIELFTYNRSENPNRVTLAAHLNAAHVAGRLADALNARNWLQPPPQASGRTEITDMRGLLRIKANLEDRPGTLAALAMVLKEHQANVIYMQYDGAKAPGLAEIALATQSPDEVSRLLQDLDQRNYHYHVEWQGDEALHGSEAASRIGEIIGLSAVERFLLSLKAVLPPAKLSELGELIHSSAELYQTLIAFRREAGGTEESMAASEVFSSILRLATASLSKTGPGFSLRVSGPVQLTAQVSLLMLACPTGANSYLLRSATDEGLLVDTSYGLYYPDVIRTLPAYGINPAAIRSVLLTHPDADHAGWAAPLQRDFGAEVYMHPEGPAILLHENRAYGSSTRLMELNGYYTKLINRFTDLQKPQTIRQFPPATGKVGPFDVIGHFAVADLDLQVLHSHGGHVPGQVFFYAPQSRSLFCGDYLIDFESLSDRTKSALSIPRYLMTSTNSDGRLFAREMQCLARLMLTAAEEGNEPSPMVFPGHGEFYRVRDAEPMLRSILAKA